MTILLDRCNTEVWFQEQEENKISFYNPVFAQRTMELNGFFGMNASGYEGGEEIKMNQNRVHWLGLVHILTSFQISQEEETT
jgi:hypothetical protein